ncbi:MAG: alpha-amylase family glycosyl hydrolase [Actinomycetia bacterium]|nr:alpha-amylase family glycosyl hydrolase [Actinomycetes bacterium]
MTVWHVYPLGFLDAPIRPTGKATLEHRLVDLIPWLGYAAGLGCDALSLGPVFASTSHGYDTVDYERIDPRLGDESDLSALLRAAHDAGLAVYLDGVFNHAGREHPLFAGALAGGDWHPDRRLFAWDARGPRYFEGHEGLPEWNHDSPEVATMVERIMRTWLARGIDGWRLDAAYATPPAFWAGVLPGVRAAFPKAYVFAEMIHGDYAGFVRSSGVDATTQYELWKAIWSSLVSVNFFELRWALQRHAALLETFAPVTFVGNHDTDRIASQVGPHRVPLALAILLTVGGSPHLYYGDERGLTGTKGSGRAADDPLRPAYPRSPADLPADGAWLADLTRQLVHLRRERPWLERATTRITDLTCARLAYTSSARDDTSLSLDVVCDLSDATHPSCAVTDAHGPLFAYRA